MCKQCHEVNGMFDAIVSDLSVGVWKAHSDGTVFYENSKVTEFINKSLIGSNISSFISDYVQREIFEELFKINTGDFVMEVSQDENTPNEKWYRMHIYKVDNLYTGTITDITNSKTILSKLLSFKREFNYNKIGFNP